MSKNVGDLAFKLVSQYDNSGANLFLKDISASQKMIQGMSESGRGPAVHPMAAAMAESNKELMAQADAEWKRTLAAKAALNDAGPTGTNPAMQQAADRLVWAEKARLRDQFYRDEAQNRTILANAEKQAIAQRLAEDLKASKTANTQRILGIVRHQQMVAGNAPMPAGVASASQSALAGAGAARGFNGAGIAQQLGFGFQDFSSQVMNSKNMVDGLGRGFMAVSNNIQMMGASFGPTTMAVTAIGGGLAGVIIPMMLKWLDLSAESTKEAERTADGIKKQISALAELRAEKEKGVPKDGKTPYLDQLNKERDEIRKRQQEVLEINRRLKDASEKTNTEKAQDAENTARRVEQWDVPARLRSGLGMMGGGTGIIESTASANAAKEEADLRSHLQEQERLLQESRQRERDITANFANELKADEDAKNSEKIKADAKVEKEHIDAMRKAAEERLQQYDRDMQHEKEFNDWVREGKEKLIKDQIKMENEKQFVLSENLDAMKKLDQNPNGSSAANVRGTGAAVSAINRAIAGTNSEESDRKKQIKLMEDQLKSSQNIERKLNLQRAAL